MKISTNNWTIKNLEKAYQQVSPRIQKTEQTKPAEKLNRLSRITGFKKAKPILPEDILSKEEKITLKRLFEQDTTFAFYGKANGQKALSGMLLDVTG